MAEKTINYIKLPDGETYKIGGSGSGFNLFDTKVSDHVLEGEEALGWALQGTYVYKESVAGSRTGYADFYNKCLEEYTNSEYSPWTQPIATGETTAIDGGNMVITCSSAYTGYDAYKAMDGTSSGTTPETGWGTNNTTGVQWWQVKFPYKIRITGLTGYQRYDIEPNNANTIGRFYTSSDKTTPIGDEYNNAIGVNWNAVSVTGIPAEGVITDTIYFEKTGGGGWGGFGELKIEATYAYFKTNANGHKFYDIANKTYIDSIYESTGIAEYYGIDLVNERIFLPRNDYFVQLTTDTNKVNKTIEAGLPNITSEPYLDLHSRRNNITTGALRYTNTYNLKDNDSGGSYWGEGTMQFDASLSNPIYGKSNTVQPPSSLKLLYICVGNTKVESAISNVTEITTSENDTLPLFYNFYSQEDMTTTGAYVNASLGSWLSGNVYTTAYNELVNKLGTGNVKANTDTYTDYDFVVNQDDMTFRLPLSNGDRVLVEKKEATTEDPTWYNLYNDGWLEQGGILANCNGAEVTIAFLIPFTNTDYSIFKSYVGTYTGAWQGSYERFYDKTIATIKTYGGADTDTYCWEAKGYADVPTNTGLNLYYKLSNAVTNLELLDVAKVTADLNTCYKRNAGDNSDLSGLAMPSDKYIDLALGASGSTYTAPANGWLCLVKGTTNYHQYVQFNSTVDNLGYRNNILTGQEVYNSGALVYACMPMLKGQSTQVFYSAGGTLYAFRFIYAQGEV